MKGGLCPWGSKSHHYVGAGWGRSPHPHQGENPVIIRVISVRQDQIFILGMEGGMACIHVRGLVFLLLSDVHHSIGDLLGQLFPSGRSFSEISIDVGRHFITLCGNKVTPWLHVVDRRQFSGILIVGRPLQASCITGGLLVIFSTVDAGELSNLVFF